MPKGPQGQKRPADAVATAVMVGRIATGEVEESAYVAPGRRQSGIAGAAARAEKLSPEERKAIAQAAAKARFKEDDMTTAIADPLAGLLFGREAKLVNLKMCRGDAPQVSAADLRSETHFALTQVALGMCETHTDFPEDRHAKRVNLTEIQNI